MSKILVIGDIHEPVAHPGYLQFCKDLRKKYHTNKTVFIGDIVDWHAISFHLHHPEAPGPADEYKITLKKVKRWHEAFPDADVMIGNHDERVVRIAEQAGIPERFIRGYIEMWDTPGWRWKMDVTIDDVFYFHGTGSHGAHPAYNAMGKRLMSVVQGHAHSAAGIKWRASPNRRVFGMDVGCGIDDKTYAFAYGRHVATRSILGAGVVLDGIPYHEIMQIGPGEKYHRSKFRK